MYKKLSAWVFLIILTAGMAWYVSGGVECIMSGSDIKESLPENYRISSGWEIADAVTDNMLPCYDKALKMRTRLTLATGSRKEGNIYISKERLLREPEIIDEKSVLTVTGYINSFYNKYSVPTCLTALPEAAEIYTECLPENASIPSQLGELDTLYENIDTKIRTIDAYHVLSTFKDSYIYYRTDSGCTANGAYFLYRSVIRKMGYSPVSYDRCTIFHVKNDVRGDLYNVCLYGDVTPDMIDVYICENSSTVRQVRKFDGNTWCEGSFYDEEALENGSARDYFTGSPCLLTEIETDVENGKKLLFIKDSYGNNMLPFLSQHYSRIDAVDINCLDRDITEITDPSEYQQVLILCSGYTFSNDSAFSFLSDSSKTGGENK
ncbi:MAG: DHHW family protein [Ruminococcus sp.]